MLWITSSSKKRFEIRIYKIVVHENCRMPLLRQAMDVLRHAAADMPLLCIKTFRGRQADGYGL